MYTPKGIDWDAQPLGRVPDRVLSGVLGVDSATVRKHRLKRHIPEAIGSGRRKIGDDPSVSSVWMRDDLGVTSDAVVARECGVSESTVRRLRRIRGIGARIQVGEQKRCLCGERFTIRNPNQSWCSKRCRNNAAQARQDEMPEGPTVALAAARRKLKIDWDQQPLGIEPDAAIAVRLGVCAETVMNARLARRIRSHKDPLVTRLLAHMDKPTTRADLCAAVDGSPIGVYQALRRLLVLGLIEEVGDESIRRGRPRVLYRKVFR